MLSAFHFSSVTAMASLHSVSFRRKLEARIATTNSLLCVGLDPHEKELGLSRTAASTDDDTAVAAAKCDAAFTFCKSLVDATREYASCYKPNAAFFEALGDGGMECLRRVCRDVIPSEIPILLDVKRGDIGATASAYAAACYDYIGADAVTLSPLMGWDSMSPFVTEKYADRGAFILCKTSNPGSNDLLNLTLRSDKEERLYERIAHLVGTDWSSRTSPDTLLGLVVGATDAVAMKHARRAAGDDVWILAPGVGAQGGDLEVACRAGLNSSGTGLLIPVSRGISTSADPAAAAKDLCEQIQAIRSNMKASTTASTKKETTDSIRPYQTEFIEFSLQQGVLKFGSFVLKSGRTSPYFFNAGLFASGAALYQLGKAYAATIMESPELVDGKGGVKFDLIFGPAYKGISLGVAVSSALYSEYGVNVGFAYNRKEAKDHGEGGHLVGDSMEGKTVLVVDDVITAGTAIRESYDLIKAANAETMGVIIALDRAEIRALDDRISAVEAVQRDLSLTVVSIINLKELQLFLEQSKDYDDQTLRSVVSYRMEYGAV